jgi:hypothetical protein
MKFTIVSVEEAKAKTPSWSGNFAKPFVVFNNETNHPAHTFATRAEAEKVAHFFNTSTTA